MTDVFFVSRQVKHGKGLADKLRRLLSGSGVLDCMAPKDLVAIKLHFGERGNTATIRPPLVGVVVDTVKEQGGRPFLTDTNALYRGYRNNAVDHLNTAVENGYAYAVVKAPVVIGDGLTGKDYRLVAVAGKHLKEAKIAAAALDADAMIVLSHFKGHELTGFGGAIKNLGMGLAARAGKLVQHSVVKPFIGPQCRGCGKCVSWCPVEAISMEGKAVIAADICIGCGECTVTCPHRAIAINWKTETHLMQEKMAEHAFAAVQDKIAQGKIGFVSFVIDVTPLCDCCGFSDPAIVPDIGILASRDPVALDQACYDLVCQAPGLAASKLGEAVPAGPDKFRLLYPEVDGTVQLRHAEMLGLGSRSYNLVHLSE